MRPSAFSHQSSIVRATKDLPDYALFWEMGTGKSRVIIDTMYHLFQEGKIKQSLIIAPNGLHSQWVSDHYRIHIDQHTFQQWFVYSTAGAQTRRQADALVKFNGFAGLRVMCMSYDGMCTLAGESKAGEFLAAAPTLLVFDESARLKTPSTRRVKVARQFAKYAAYRRILSGTPISNSPFDLWSQLDILSPGYWKYAGVSSWSAFRGRFGVFQKGFVRASAGLRQFNQVVGYKDLDKLSDMIRPICNFLTKDEAIDLPPKTYSTLKFSLKGEQKALYASVYRDFVAEIRGQVVAAPLAITRLMRLAQITSNYAAVVDGPMMPINENNGKLEVLNEAIMSLEQSSAVIWCRFTRTVDDIMAMLGDTAVRYDGQVSEADRELAVERFQGGTAQFFVAKPSCAGEGLNLTRASTVIYVENSYSLMERQQSEDRAHRIGQAKNVQVIDIVAADTVDEIIVAALKEKKVLADLIREIGNSPIVK